MSFPETRMRRLRRTEPLRSLVRETSLDPGDLIYPLFLCPGEGVRRPVGTMPGVFNLSVDEALREAEEAARLGLGGLLLFGLPESKDEQGSGAWDENGIVQQGLRALKESPAAKKLVLIADVCLCEYTSHGHCGVVVETKDGFEVENDSSLDLLARTAVSLARAGADVVAPSDMMDGRVSAIRRALDDEGCEQTPILSYASKFASAFYGPFRESRKKDSRRPGRLLWSIAAALVAAIFTRYDGWVMALLAWVCVGLVLARRSGLRSRAFWLASALVVAAPAAWFIYNAAAFGDWLYFLRGPYSAKAIEIRTSVPGFPPHPGWHNPWVGLIFFLKTAELDAAASAWGNLLLALSLLGTAWAWLTARRRAFAWALLLWLPVPFYVYSVAWGSVPIFLPLWWPHSWYNLRYGMELLPAFALGLGFAAQLTIAAVHEFKPRWANYAATALFALVALNAGQMLRERPLVYVESTKNIQARRPYEIQIPPALRALLAERPGGVVLMDTSVYPEIVALTGIPLLQTINESDLEIYRAALAAPAAHAAIVLAFDGDEVDRAVHAHPAGLTAYRRFTATGQPSATIYVSSTPASQALNKQTGSVIASGKAICNPEED